MNKTLDIHKAIRLIEESQISEDVFAGFREDFLDTRIKIFSKEKGLIVDNSYSHLSSTWATPVVLIDSKMEDCYILEKEDSEILITESRLKSEKGEDF